MRKIVVLLICLVVVNFFASEAYERVIYKSGNWLIEQQDSNGRQMLIIRYEGSFELLRTIVPIERKDTIGFRVNSDTVLKSIYLACETSKEQRITIESQGKTFGPYQAKPTETGEYVFEPATEIVLKKGEYTLKFSDPSTLIHDPLTGPAVVITGVDVDLYKNVLKEKVTDLSQEGNRGAAIDEAVTPSLSGRGTLFENSPAQKLSTNAQLQKKPLSFSLDESTFLDEVAIDLLMKPVDLPQTHIFIYDKNNNTYGPYYFSELDTKNGIIFFAPKVVLPPGTYTIKVSDQSAVNYEKDGKPIFALKSFPYDPPFDFTGTYKINFKVTRVRTLKGASEKTTLDIKLFEVGLIDHGDFLELVGKIDLSQVVQLLEEQTGRKVEASYEGEVFPFSQACEIVERSKESVQCKFLLGLNFTNLPIVNKFIVGQTSAVVLLTFKTRSGLTPGVTISGNAKYVRINDPHLGTDMNDYVITGDGYRTSEKLPAFVMSVLTQKFGSAGNVPGPSSPQQALTGLLFPPLAAAIGYALQELLKPKPGGVSEVFSDYTRSARGAARKAAAAEAARDELGSTVSSSSESESINDEYEASEESYQESYEETATEPETPYTEQSQTPQTETQPTEQPAQEQGPVPTTVTVIADHTGRTKEVTYDPKTGEWITEDGNLFNWEVYEKIFLPNLPKEKAWIEDQRDKMMQPTELEPSKDDAREKYIQQLEKKYGVSSDKLKDAIAQNMDKNLADSEKSKSDADWYNNAYKAAKVTQIFADNAIDGLAACTGAPGKFVRAVYKGTKAFVPDEEGEGITWGKAIGVGTDIASDFITFSSPWKEAAFKTAGSTIGGAVDKGIDGAVENFVDSAISNSFEAFAKNIGGKGYGDDVGKYKNKWWNPEMSNIVFPTTTKNAELLTSSTGKDISRLVSGKLIREMKLQGTKTAAAYTSEMFVKPMIKGD